jgi:hypothetical protein
MEVRWIELTRPHEGKVKMLNHNRNTKPNLVMILMFVASMACSIELPGDVDEIATQVAAGLTQVANDLTATALAVETTPPEGTDTPTLEPPTATYTPTPPPGGVSMNCDGTYQKLTIVDGGALGKTATLYNWNGSAWIEVWSVSGGDPMMQQIEAEAGLYPFGPCRQFIIIPLRYSGSGVLLDLTVYEWTGAAVSQVYFHQGVHGDWYKDGDSIVFEESLYLYGEPNCCPCNRQTLRHTWNGSAFVQTDLVIAPTYTGTPPDHCTP